MKNIVVRSLLFLSALLVGHASAQDEATGIPSDAGPVRRVRADLERRFTGGVVAVVEGRVVTVTDVMRLIEPSLPRLLLAARDSHDFENRWRKEEAATIAWLGERARMVSEIRKRGTLRIEPVELDAAFAATFARDFGGDRARFAAFLRAEGKTARDFRASLEDELLLVKASDLPPK